MDTTTAPRADCGCRYLRKLDTAIDPEPLPFPGFFLAVPCRTHRDPSVVTPMELQHGRAGTVRIGQISLAEEYS